MAEDNPAMVVSAPQVLALEDELAIITYWTPERMEEAKPLELPTLRGRPEGGQGVPTADEADQPVEQSAVAPDGSQDLALANFVTTRVANMNIWPYMTVGKLYMTFAGVNYQGSAWCIGESAIFTAGHCVHGKSAGWATNVIFRARYSNGSSIGTWVMRTLGSLNGWINNEDFQYDMGSGVATRPIRPTTGKSGWMANYPANQGPYTSIGYPAAPISGYPFNGQYMWQCVGGYINGATIIQMHNNMTGGCSGGPWVVYRNGQWYANGLNSFRYTSNPNTLYSPYFGQGFLNLLQWIKNNGGD